MTPYRVPLAARLVDALANQAPHLPDAEANGELLHPDVNRAYQALRANAVGAEDLLAHCKTTLDGVYLDGFVIIEAAPLLDLGPEHGPRAAIALLTWIATPLNIVDALPLWQPLGTDPASEPAHVTSTGYHPFQIDIVKRHTTTGLRRPVMPAPGPERRRPQPGLPSPPGRAAPGRRGTPSSGRACLHVRGLRQPDGRRR
ncbi:hypothetical protein [Streptomyces flavofungini]|uniref:Uncharacterized protein n=1 Tax=Streptomyces flavofungini TaxID=68200 RepID=A0ABS0XGN5_9ACTN|nr:hypothetical protein [Streptomyces flavofungini]MBJ3812345.1 hypothetical protein [Streptomyces flavofungini]GHC88311.1 hypothetical protein GCM10010349_75490 [Streptomyces flavofungini]